MQLLGDAMLQWMSRSQMRYLLLDSKRLRVLHAIIVSSPPDISQVLVSFFEVKFYLLMQKSMPLL